MQPTGVAYGLSFIADYAIPATIDVMKQARPWTKGYDAAWSEIEPYLDSDGYPTQIPPGWTTVRSVWAFPEFDEVEGPWVLTYVGEGTVTMAGVTVTSSTAGRIVFTNPGPAYSVQFDIEETDPLDNGEYIRDMHLFLLADETAFNNGQVFKQWFIDLHRDADGLRFMDWMQSIDNSQVDWADRPTTTSRTWYGSDYDAPSMGAPVEVMVALANELGFNPWFNIPLRASDDYVTQFITYIRDNLNVGLVATIEWGNEIWNSSGAFNPQFAWVTQQAIDLWGTDEVEFIAPGALDYQAMRATQVAKICHDLFTATGQRAQLKNVLGIQTGGDWWLQNRMLNTLVWTTKNTPTPVLDPLDYFDGICCTTYWGSSNTLRSDLNTYRATHTDEESSVWLVAQLMDPEVDESIPHIVTKWQAQRTALDSFGAPGEAMEMVAYEGGQHLHDNVAAADPGDTGLGEFLYNFTRSSYTAYLYEQSWDAFELHLDGPYMHLSKVGVNDFNKSWSLLDNPSDKNERYRCSTSRALGLPYEEGKFGLVTGAA